MPDPYFNKDAPPRLSDAAVAQICRTVLLLAGIVAVTVFGVHHPAELGRFLGGAAALVFFGFVLYQIS